MLEVVVCEVNTLIGRDDGLAANTLLKLLSKSCISICVFIKLFTLGGTNMCCC